MHPIDEWSLRETQPNRDGPVLNPTSPPLRARPWPITAVDDIKPCITTLRTLNYGNYGAFFIMGNAGFLSSAVLSRQCPMPPNPTLTSTISWVGLL